MPKKQKSFQQPGLVDQPQLIELLERGFTICDSSSRDGRLEVVKVSTIESQNGDSVEAYATAAQLEELVDQNLVERTVIMPPGCGPHGVWHKPGHWGVAHWAVKIEWVNRTGTPV